jgi:uncharacterized protein (DUF1810 family)
MKKLLALLALAGVGGGAYWYFFKRDPAVPAGDSVSTFLENVMGTKPRGLRNNNPGNIIWNSVNNWNGQTGRDDGGYAIFDKPENGIRAMNKTLNTYATTGRNTARKIIESWTSGDPAAIQSNYMLKVEQLTGKSRDSVLGAADRLNLIKAIILFENANQNPFSDSLILSAMALQ